MSIHKSSPFYNEAEDPHYWQRVFPMTCRTYKHRNRKPGYTYDVERNMWVCGECRKPSIHHDGYVRECLGCERPFVVWEYIPATVDYEFCTDCGGTNNAEPGVVTNKPGVVTKFCTCAADLLDGGGRCPIHGRPEHMLESS